MMMDDAMRKCSCAVLPVFGGRLERNQGSAQDLSSTLRWNQSGASHGSPTRPRNLPVLDPPSSDTFLPPELRLLHVGCEKQRLLPPNPGCMIVSGISSLHVTDHVRQSRSLGEQGDKLSLRGWPTVRLQHPFPHTLCQQRTDRRWLQSPESLCVLEPPRTPRRPTAPDGRQLSIPDYDLVSVDQSPRPGLQPLEDGGTRINVREYATGRPELPGSTSATHCAAPGPRLRLVTTRRPLPPHGARVLGRPVSVPLG